MKKNASYLDPKRKLVDETVDWLCGSDRYESRVRITPEGVRSLSHILVIVPTAQSARNLRYALARKAASCAARGGIVPPLISMPGALLEPRDVRIATEAEELSAMASVLSECDITRFRSLFPKVPEVRDADWALDMSGMILGISSVLGEAALSMSEVKPPLDLERWRELAEIEKAFIAKFRSSGATPRSVARREAVKAGCLEEGIEEIVLPSAVDIQSAFIRYLENSRQSVSVLIHADADEGEKFDEWGRVQSVFPHALAPEAIDSSPTAVIEADEIAKYFREVKSDEALPALVVCDAEMHPELEGAFQNVFSEEELVLRNPSKELLSKSSLGRLLGAVMQLDAERAYEPFSTLIRMGDVARWACGALSATSAQIAKYTGALDAIQNAHLPQTLDETIDAARSEAENARRQSEREAAAGLKRLAEAVRAELDDPFGFLRKIFASVTLDEKSPRDRELIAAAETVRSLREECSGALVAERFKKGIFRRLLKSAAYMLEPVAENILSTTGWLEVPWCLDDEMVIAGFNEGCVPENVVGHPFVPDSLRKDLSLTSNARREARDSFILAQAVACRAKGAISVHVHQIAGDKNVMKPSRLLFNGISDEDLSPLALRLYAVTKGSEGAPAKEMPPAWRLTLPIPPKDTLFREKMSPTALDQYLRCPFNFYLQEVFGSHSDDRNQELDAMAFGNLCHSALEAFAKEGPKDSVDAAEIADFLAGHVHGQLQAFGMNLPAIIELQGEAAIERLRAFSVHQAARRREGWEIVSSERNLTCRIKNCPTLFSGKVDRIDRHETTGDIAIIDYKTWNRAKEENYDSVQLPLYRAMVEACGVFDPQKARSSKAFYCILAERPEDTKFDEEHAFHEGSQSEAEDRIVALATAIAKGIFYPPKKTSGLPAWMSEYASLIWESPEKGIDCAWLEDQKSRLAQESE